jgi:hypothetical protein
LRPLRVEPADGFAQLEPETDPASVALVLSAARKPFLLQFAEPLPARLLDGAAEALREHPDVALRAYGSADPSLEWLPRFAHIRGLTLDLREASSFEAVAVCSQLERLSLGETSSRRPSLGFLRNLPKLERLFLEGHDRDFEVVSELRSLRRLDLRVPRAKSLEPLVDHPALELLTISFGGIRDLSPLPQIPRLRGLELYQVRKLDTADLEPLRRCERLEALSLGALRNVEHLDAMPDGVRLLVLERLLGLATLRHLGRLRRLEQLFMTEARPTDRRLDVLPLERLRHLVVGDVYPREQLDAVERTFRGETWWYRGEERHTGSEPPRARWRADVEQLLAEPQPH